MGSENKVAVEITLEEKAALKALTSLTKKVQNTEDGFTKLGKEADASLSVVGEVTKGVSDGFGTLVKGVTIANLASDAIVGTANAIKNFAIDSVKAAIEAENATQKLGQSLRAVGAFSEQTVSDFLDYAGALSQVTVFSDDAIVEQLALAKSFGASNQQAKDLVKAAAELSATFGGSLDQRVEQLGKTFSGTAGKLSQLIPGFKNLTEEQLKSGAAIDLINSKYSGSAAAQLDTYGGKLSQLTKAFGELQESLGAIVVESGVAGVFESITFAINDYTQSLNDAKIAQARQSGGLVETSGSLEQLKRQYDELKVKAIDLEQTIINPKFGAGSDKTAIFIAKKQLAELNTEIAKTKAQIDVASPQVQAAQDAAPKGDQVKVASPEDDARVLKEREVQAAIFGIREQAKIAEAEQKALIDETNLGNKDLEVAAIYEFEALKLEAQFQAEEQKANLIKDAGEKSLKLKEIQAKRELEFTKLGNAQIRAENDRKLKDQQSTNAALIVTATNFLAAGQLLAKEGSNAQKALQITQATMATYAAANNALAQPVPYPVAVAMAASAVALGLANVAKIAGAKFEQGGIVGGNSMTGDNIGVRVNSGEMILNRQQQSTLFSMANGSQSNGGNTEQLERLITALNNQSIVLTLDGREIARSVRSQVQQGFKIA